VDTLPCGTPPGLDVDIIMWWIGSGREVDLGKPGNELTDAIEQSKDIVNWEEDDDDKTQVEITRLLENFKYYPKETRYQVRARLGWCDEAAAEIFALVVFVSDGLLKTKATKVKTGAKKTRFFLISSQLPLELQMVLCYRLAGSAKEIIHNTDSEAAFRELAKRI